MKTVTVIREFLQTGLSRLLFRMVIVWALAVSGSLMALSYVQEVLLTGQPIEYWTLGFATLALIGFAGFCGNPFELGFLQSPQTAAWDRSRVSRVAVFYLVAIGWSVMLGFSVHWAFGAAFVAFAMISVVAFGYDSSQLKSHSTDSSQNPTVHQDDQNESSFATFLRDDSGFGQTDDDQELEERIPIEIVRQVTYSMSDSGGTCVTAYLRHRFVAKQTSDAIHLPLHPPLKNVPDADIIQLEGPDLDTRVTDCSRFGVRLELRLDQQSVEAVDVLLEINLSESNESRLAQAG